MSYTMRGSNVVQSLRYLLPRSRYKNGLGLAEAKSPKKDYCHLERRLDAFFLIAEKAYFRAFSNTLRPSALLV